MSLTDEQIAMVRLWLADSPTLPRKHDLLRHFGTASALFATSSSAIEAVLGVERGSKAETARELLAGDDRDAREFIARCEQEGVGIVVHGDAGYPASLAEILPAPLALTVRGSLEPPDELAIAVVGSRRCTSYGRRMAQELAGDLARAGYTIVSGLARGIDGVAHKAALDAGGRTVAVLASGLCRIYPPEHAELAKRVAASGAVISEAQLDGAPLANLFTQRNRIISGLSVGVVVVEAAERSGALSTAHHALDQNRDVFAVPGRVGDPTSDGANGLIRKGAIAVTSARDIVEQMRPLGLPMPIGDSKSSAVKSTSAKASVGKPPGLNPIEGKLWDAIGPNDIEFERLLDATGLRASQASAALLVMELNRLVRRQPGNRFERWR